MYCPFLSGDYMLFCRASRESYIPSNFELDEYCKVERYKMCPFYCKTEARGTLIFTDEADFEQSGISPSPRSSK